MLLLSALCWSLSVLQFSWFLGQKEVSCVCLANSLHSDAASGMEAVILQTGTGWVPHDLPKSTSFSGKARVRAQSLGYLCSFSFHFVFGAS